MGVSPLRSDFARVASHEGSDWHRVQLNRDVVSAVIAELAPVPQDIEEGGEWGVDVE